MATLDSDKVTGVSVVSDASDAVNANYVTTNKPRYQSPLASDVGKFVQYAGSAYYWNLRTSGFGAIDITSSSYGNGYHVIGGAQTLSSSTDAVAWSLRTTGTSQTFNQIVYGDQYTSGKDIFVAGSSGGEVRSSTDSIGWFLRSSGFGSTAISGATYSTLNGGEFLLGGASTTITDWWQLRTAGTTSAPVSTIYGDLPVPTYLVRLFNTRSLRGSTDTITWTLRTNGGSGNTIQSIAYGLVGDQPLYVSVDTNAQINTSTDSITWTLRTSGQSTSGNFYTTAAGSLDLGKENFIAGGQSTTNAPLLRSSTDGIHWAARSSGFGSTVITASGYGGGYYFIGGSAGVSSPLSVSTDGISWIRKTSGTSLNIYGFAYGTNNGVPNYIFHGQSGLIATSTDTNTWILRTAGSTSDIGLAGGSNGSGTAMTYNNGVYVYVNTGGGVRVSTDAITWTLKDFPAAVTAAYSIAYANNYYFVGANGGNLPVSIQDISTSQPLINTFGLGGLLQASTDTITWTTRSTGYGIQSISQLTFGGSYSLAYGKNDIGIPFLSASTNNIIWTFRTSGFGLSTINAFTYGNGIYIAAGDGGLLSTSTDSFIWTIRTSGSISNFESLGYGNDIYLSGTFGGGIRVSTNAIIWSLRTSNSSTSINRLTYDYDNRQFISGEASGALETSITGRISWQSINLPSSSILVPTYKGAEEFTTAGAQTFIIPPTASQFYIECVGAGGGGASGRINGTLGSGGGGGSGAYNSWLIRRPELAGAKALTVTPGTRGQGGTNRGLSTSTDGINWIASPYNTSGASAITLYASGYGNGLYVVAGDNGYVFVSTDASSWSLRTSGMPTTQTIGSGYGNGFVYGDKYVVAGIAGGYLNTSTDTITWTPRTIPNNITNIIYANNLYVATNGYNLGNLLYTSVDAITWVLRTVGYTSSAAPSGLAFANTTNTGNENRYVVADSAGRFATSTNAIQWTFRTSGTTAAIYQIINDGTNYYGVGTAGTLMVSTNAIQWSFRTSGFGSTTINSIAYNASLTEKYLIGGDVGLTKTSTDGIVWVARTSLFKNQNVETVNNLNNIYIAGGVTTSTPTAGTASAVTWTVGATTYTLGAGGGTGASDTAVTGGTGASAAPIFRNALYTVSGLSGAAGNSVNGPANSSTQANPFQPTGGGGGAFNTNTGGSGLAYYYGNTYTNGGNASGASGSNGIPGSYTGNIGGGGGGGGALSSGFNTWINRTSGFTNAVINLAYGSSTYLANNSIAGGGGLRGSTDSINWQLRTAGFGTTAIGSITYSTFNSGEFLAGGRVETEVWSQRTSGTSASLNSTMYDGTNFFVGGASGFLSVSTDGISWTLRTSGTASAIGSATFGGNALLYASGQTFPYVYWSGTNIYSSSTDGISWTLRTAGLATPYSIAFGTSPVATYVIGGTTGRIMTSTNSIIWVLRTSNTTNNINSIVYNDAVTNKYVVAGEVGIVITSTNAIQWTLRTSGNALTFYQSIYGSVFVASGRNGVLSTSTNAVQWTLRTSGFGTTVYGLAYNNGIYIASGTNGSTRSSTDAIIWTLRTSGFGTSGINNSVAGNNIFINVGNAGTLTTSTYQNLSSYGVGALLQASTDSITWTARTTSLNTQTITSLGFGGSYVFAHGTNYMGEVGFLNVSTDNIIWVSRTSGFGSTAITAFGYGASSPTAYYVALGNNQLSASTDTITWAARTTSFGANVVNAFVYGDKYIAAGASGIVSSSTDTITWTLRTSGFGTTNISSLVYGNSVYVAAGDAGTLAKSSDGIVWERRNSGFGTTAIDALIYGTSYVAGGDNGTITVSAGGTSQSVAGNGGHGTRGGGGGGGAYSVEQGKFGIGGEGGDGYVKITWW